MQHYAWTEVKRAGDSQGKLGLENKVVGIIGRTVTIHGILGLPGQDYG